MLSHVDELTFCHAYCKKCIEEFNGTILTPEYLNTMKAQFTKKISGDCGLNIDVGANDKYVPTCRKHH